VTERGGITLTELEAVVSAAADRAQAEVVTPEIDTVVWEEVSARTSDDSAFSVSFGALMVLAGIIAAIAVVTNNSVLIVGAMIVSPDYGPMAALSVALVNRRPGRPVAAPHAGETSEPVDHLGGVRTRRTPLTHPLIRP
jgi:hypothetical protein